MLQGLAARLAAAQVIAGVVTKRLPLDELFGETPSPLLAGLDARDRGLTRSIATVGLRRLGTIRKALAGMLERGMPAKAGTLQWHLIVGIAQILFLDIPDHAAVDLGVHAVRSAPDSTHFAKLANGVLRNTVRQREALLNASNPLDDDTPAWLATRWRRTFGEEHAQAIAAAHRLEPTLDLSFKTDAAAWAERLDGVLLPTGSLRLRTHDLVRDLPGYAEGAWWVQDAAAALPAKLLRPAPGERIADLCAAPGGKTAALAAAGAAVTAVDRSAERVRRLTANLDRLGLPVTVVTQDVLAYEAEPFDAVLLDAPCTATGTVRRHPDVAWIKQESDVGRLAKHQSRMLERAVALVKPGGRLVYCTCSLEPEEGEAQIAALLARDATLARDPVTPAEIGGLAECISPDGDLRTLPLHLPGSEPRLAGLDGFFAARLMRHG